MIKLQHTFARFINFSVSALANCWINRSNTFYNEINWKTLLLDGDWNKIIIVINKSCDNHQVWWARHSRQRKPNVQHFHDKPNAVVVKINLNGNLLAKKFADIWCLVCPSNFLCRSSVRCFNFNLLRWMAIVSPPTNFVGVVFFFSVRVVVALILTLFYSGLPSFCCPFFLSCKWYTKPTNPTNWKCSHQSLHGNKIDVQHDDMNIKVQTLNEQNSSWRV